MMGDAVVAAAAAAAADTPRLPRRARLPPAANIFVPTVATKAHRHPRRAHRQRLTLLPPSFARPLGVPPTEDNIALEEMYKALAYGYNEVYSCQRRSIPGASRTWGLETQGRFHALGDAYANALAFEEEVKAKSLAPVFEMPRAISDALAVMMPRAP